MDSFLFHQAGVWSCIWDLLLPVWDVTGVKQPLWIIFNLNSFESHPRITQRDYEEIKLSCTSKLQSHLGLTSNKKFCFHSHALIYYVFIPMTCIIVTQTQTQRKKKKGLILEIQEQVENERWQLWDLGTFCNTEQGGWKWTHRGLRWGGIASPSEILQLHMTLYTSDIKEEKWRLLADTWQVSRS